MSRYRIPGTDDGDIIFAVCFVIALGLGFIGLPLFVWETAIQASKNLTAMNEALHSTASVGEATRTHVIHSSGYRSPAVKSRECASPLDCLPGVISVSRGGQGSVAKAAGGVRSSRLVSGHPVFPWFERHRLRDALATFNALCKLSQRRCQAFAEHPHSSVPFVFAGFNARDHEPRGRGSVPYQRGEVPYSRGALQHVR